MSFNNDSLFDANESDYDFARLTNYQDPILNATTTMGGVNIDSNTSDATTTTTPIGNSYQHSTDESVNIDLITSDTTTTTEPMGNTYKRSTDEEYVLAMGSTDIDSNTSDTTTTTEPMGNTYKRSTDDEDVLEMSSVNIDSITSDTTTTTEPMGNSYKRSTDDEYVLAMGSSANIDSITSDTTTTTEPMGNSYKRSTEEEYVLAEITSATPDITTTTISPSSTSISTTSTSTSASSTSITTSSSTSASSTSTSTSTSSTSITTTTSASYTSTSTSTSISSTTTTSSDAPQGNSNSISPTSSQPSQQTQSGPTEQEISKLYTNFCFDYLGVPEGSIFEILNNLYRIPSSNTRVRSEVKNTVQKFAPMAPYISRDQLSQILQSFFTQKDRWLDYEVCSDRMKVAQSRLELIWSPRGIHMEKQPWDTFLKSLMRWLRLSSVPMREQQALERLFLVTYPSGMGGGVVLEKSFHLFSVLYAVRFPMVNSNEEGMLFLKEIADLNEKIYYVGIMSRDKVELILKKNSNQCFLLRITERESRFCISSRRPNPHELLEREQYYERGVLDYIENVVINKLGLKPIERV